MSTSSFDYVIVGGGLAGLVLAARLSEDANIEVLVIEAGEDQTADPRVTIPGMWPTLIRSESAWNYNTVAQVS
jgi:choline dehydrogenase-like flavoprotein